MAACTRPRRAGHRTGLWAGPGAPRGDRPGPGLRRHAALPHQPRGSAARRGAGPAGRAAWRSARPADHVHAAGGMAARRFGRTERRQRQRRPAGRRVLAAAAGGAGRGRCEAVTALDDAARCACSAWCTAPSMAPAWACPQPRSWPCSAWPPRSSSWSSWLPPSASPCARLGRGWPCGSAAAGLPQAACCCSAGRFAGLERGQANLDQGPVGECRPRLIPCRHDGGR